MKAAAREQRSLDSSLGVILQLMKLNGVFGMLPISIKLQNQYDKCSFSPTVCPAVSGIGVPSATSHAAQPTFCRSFVVHFQVFVAVVHVMRPCCQV